MIYIEIKGGLGNQMFQFAAAYALAKNNKTKIIVLPVMHGENNKANYTKRSFELKRLFNLENVIIAEKAELDFANGISMSFYQRIKRRIMRLDYFCEKSLEYNSLFFQVRKNAYIEGYFQSENYFSKERNDLLRIFRFDLNKLSFNTTQLITRIKSSNSIALHVRRGDYVNNSEINQLHGTCGLEYYNRAISAFDDYSDKVFFIFSDDIAWARINLKIKGEHHYVDWNEGENSWQDMFLMSLCNHFIIANSSFSWWGAWLSERPNKKVIAPLYWFSNKEKNKQTKDLIPPSWIRI